MLCSRKTLAAAVMASLALPVPQVKASPTSIGVFFDADATDCDASVSAPSSFNFYVSAVLGTDAAASGITGAEFRVDGLRGIVASVIPNPASAFFLGNPTLGGCVIAFPACVAGGGSRSSVLLCTIACSAAQPVSPRTVTVNYVSTPSSDPPWLPDVVLCDEPNYTALYVSGGQALLNNGSCTVGVQPTTWSTVKSMFTANPAQQAPTRGRS